MVFWALLLGFQCVSPEELIAAPGNLLLQDPTFLFRRESGTMGFLCLGTRRVEDIRFTWKRRTRFLSFVNAKSHRIRSLLPSDQLCMWRLSGGKGIVLEHRSSSDRERLLYRHVWKPHDRLTVYDQGCQRHAGPASR